MRCHQRAKRSSAPRVGTNTADSQREEPQVIVKTGIFVGVPGLPVIDRQGDWREQEIALPILPPLIGNSARLTACGSRANHDPHAAIW